MRFSIRWLRRRNPGAFIVPVLLLFATASVAEKETPESTGGAELIEMMMALDSQLDQTVISTTKSAQRAQQAPAVVTVINAEEIQARGYTSIADVLRTVPGLYDVYDLVTHNVGVRGINGGARASGSVLKLMIDGQPVHFRSSTGNFFGEELIPLSAVERVEVIRGPASALYGANAFLGVVNVITRSGDAAKGVQLIGQGGAVRTHPAWGGGLQLGFGGDRGQAMAAVNVMRIDRSGLTVAESSPILDETGSAIRGKRSEDDLSRPRSIFAKGSVNIGETGRVGLWASVQNLDAVGAFQDFGPLNERTRIALVNQNYRLSWEVQPLESVSLKLSGTWFDSSPSAEERLDIGKVDPRLLFVRQVGVKGYEVSAEAGIEVAEPLSLTLGIDFVEEDHLLQTFDTLLLEDIVAADGSVLRAAGTVMPGEKHGQRKTFTNIGAFAQAVYRLGDAWGFTVGTRLDHHNVYETNLSPRAAIVYAPPEKPWSLKLLYGSSFKAPSAEQLYTQPLQQLDIKGNEALRAQNARTGEVAMGYRVGDLGEISANLFVTEVTGRVEFIQRGVFLKAENTLNELLVGGELDARLRIAQPLTVRVGGSVIQTVNRERAEQDLLFGAPEVDHALFPPWQAHLIVDWALPVFGLRFSPEVSYVGPRGASQSNTLERGEAYDLPAYLYTAASLSTTRAFFEARPTAISLRVTNLFDQQDGEPGFGKIDVPMQGRTLFLTLVQSL